MSEARAPLSPEAIHAILKDAADRVAVIRGISDRVSCDSAFAIGLSLGHLASAMGLVGRDIDDARSKA